MIARGLIGGYHRVIVVRGGQLMECKEELKKKKKNRCLPCRGSLMIARGLIGGYHRVVVVWGGRLMECKEELKQQMSTLQGGLDDSKRAYRWVS